MAKTLLTLRVSGVKKSKIILINVSSYGHDDDEDEADIFSGAITTNDEMNGFEKRLNDKTYRKKMVGEIPIFKK